MPAAYSILPLGDSALIIDFGNRIDEQLNKKVLTLFNKLIHLSPFIKDVVPAYSSIGVYYETSAFRTKEKTAFEAVKALIQPLLMQDQHPIDRPGRQLRIPVCYAKPFAMDLDELAKQKKLTTEEFIHLHTAQIYRVYLIGFLPGFAYMGRLDDRIASARKRQPRNVVPAGSVGIAGNQTGIYPLASPGGWNIIGRSPLKIFDKDLEQPVFFQPGDEIQFYSITEDEFDNYKGGHT